MSKRHTIIYIPGLGDAHLRGQGFIMNLWRIYHVNVIVYRINWAENEPFEPKLQKLALKIDELTDNGQAVSLVGASAGASAALNAFALKKDKIHRVVCICGKIKNLQAINDNYFMRNPTFKGSVDILNSSLEKMSIKDRKKILSIHPLYDTIVPIADTKIEGSQEKVIPTIGHLLSIGYAISFGSFGIISFMKKTL